MKNKILVGIAIVVSLVGLVLAGLAYVGLQAKRAEQASENTPDAGKIKGIELPKTDQRSVFIDVAPYEAGVSPELDSVYALYEARLTRLSAEASSTRFGRPPIFLLATYDLDSDGRDEVFTALASSESCTEKGCELALHQRASDGQWKTLNSWWVPPDSAYLLPFKTDGWNDIAFGPGTAGFGVWRIGENGQYVQAGVAPTIPKPEE